MKIASIVLGALSVLTLVPSLGASKACLIGYKTKCSFSPVSTFILLGGAGFFLVKYFA